MSLLKFFRIWFWLMFWNFLASLMIFFACGNKLKCLTRCFVIDWSPNLRLWLTVADSVCNRCGLGLLALLVKKLDSSFGKWECSSCVCKLTLTEPPTIELRWVWEPLTLSSYWTDSMPAIILPANCFFRNGLSLRLRSWASAFAMLMIFYALLSRDVKLWIGTFALREFILWVGANGELAIPGINLWECAIYSCAVWSTSDFTASNAGSSLRVTAAEGLWSYRFFSACLYDSLIAS